MQITLLQPIDPPEPGLAEACEPWLRIDATSADVSLCRGRLESRSCFDSAGHSLRVTLAAGDTGSAEASILA